MKTRKNIYFKVVALAVIAIAFAMPAKAQLSDNGYANIDWQFNAPLSNHFADKASGWGMNFEGGYSQHRFGTFPELSQQPRICRSRNIQNGRW